LRSGLCSERLEIPTLEVAFIQDIHIVRGWVDASTRIVALTGAGISTDSGIPDFRGPQGVWTRDPKAERLSNIHHYMSNPEVRKLSWKSRLDHPAWQAKPNAGHGALVELERRGKLHALITQNIDGLHQQAGNSPEKVIEVHGTLHQAMCMQCEWRGGMQDVLNRVRAGEEDPPCERFGGILKSATIAFKAYKISLNGRPAPVIDGLTGDQRFFMGWAQVWRGKYREYEQIRRIKVDPHSPPSVRGVAPLKNQNAFFDAFSIKDGDHMFLVPAKRVTIW